MATPFAALESRLAAVTLAKFANATATINGIAVDGVFDEMPDPAFGGMISDTSPVFVCALSTAVAVDDTLSINGKNYVAVAVDGDGRGGRLVKLK